MPHEHQILKTVVFRLVKKYIAGNNIGAVLEEARRNSSLGVRTVATFLNDDVNDAAKARYNANAYVQFVKQASRLNLNAEVSIRLGQLGFWLNDGILDRCMEDIAVASKESKTRIWIEAETSIGMDALFAAYRKYKHLGGHIGMEVPVWYPLEVEIIRSNLKKNDMVKLTSYSTAANAAPKDEVKPRARQKGKKNGKDNKSGKEKAGADIMGHYVSHIGKLLQAGVGVSVLEHDEHLVERLAGFSKEYKKNLIFELPFGYNSKDLAKLVKMKVNLGVYAPYGKDWGSYVINRLTSGHGKMREIAARVLYENANSERVENAE